ncbi:hypothetical protein L873DRAFT_1804231 [Choiromyces venosus 120613-1]|uniref:Uncharacterized protein n=1 Tax=Choiromyces venosus 120613-1 TaxID=1336337 RepID=A0A3N4K4T8_9PEZI|nr:hypothetical protein L873DRAFT_1804231 [Choiromyces venosus 120613-1]
MLVVGMLGTFEQMENNQGVDRILKGSEYAAKYNLGYHVSQTRIRSDASPYSAWRNCSNA